MPVLMTDLRVAKNSNTKMVTDIISKETHVRDRAERIMPKNTRKAHPII
jgi:hypothetical protein